MAGDIRKQLFDTERRAESNLTALMDLTFILLITFMVTFPMVEQSSSVQLPSGTGNPLRPDESMAITIDAENRIFLGPDSLTLEELESRVTQLKQSQPEIVLLLRGDKTVDYGRVMEVFQLLQRAGLTRVALVTQVDKAALAPRPP
jgi:biopolymer transport protein ExbD